MASKAAIPNFEEGVEWLIDFKCENPKCGKPTKIFPTRVDDLGYRLRDTEEDKGITAIYCEECREVYSDSEEAIQAKRDSIKPVPNNK
jgi:hypothetical protein